MSGEIVSQFERSIAIYFESGQVELHGTSRVEEIAKELNMSPCYLSDSLKTETDKTAIEHIHLYLIDEAKNLLLGPQNTISDTAYKLGFDNPHYFSRLFKKKVRISRTIFTQLMKTHKVMCLFLPVELDRKTHLLIS